MAEPKLTDPVQAAQEPVPAGMVTADFPIIALGLGNIEIADALHEGLPALWFGRGGRGLDAPDQELNRLAHDKETLTVFTFADVRGINAMERALRRVREKFFPAASAQEQSK